MNICISTYPRTSVTVWIPVHTAPKCGTEPIRYVTLHFRDWHGAASLRYKNGDNAKSLLFTESLFGMIFSPVKQRGEVWRHVTMVALFLDDNKTNDDGDGEENGKKKMFINNKQ